jgi:autotransporter-associated beta strand protein/T5SS/PEP-CTERM-associated repeat protein
MTKKTWVCACAGCVQFIAAAATVNWTGTGGDTLFSNPGNWNTGTVPIQDDQATFPSATPVTVTFPSGGYPDKSVTETAANPEVTFDTRGTWWLKPADSTWGNPTFRIGGAAHGFNIESVNNAKAQMLLSNGVFRAVATPAVVTATLESGFLNFYTPDGIDSGNKVVIGHDTARRHEVVLEPGTTSFWKSIEFRGKGPENVFRVNGGRHEVFYNFDIANQSSPVGTTALVHIAGGELVTHYYNHLGVNKAQVGRVVIATNGQWTSKQTIEMGNSGYGVLDIAGGTLWQDCGVQNHNLNIGHSAGCTGVVNVTAGRLVNTNYQVLVGHSGRGFLNVSGGRVDVRYTHVGFNASATGTLAVTGGEWRQHGNGTIGNNGRGEMTVSGGSFTAENDWFSVGRYASSVGRMTLAGGYTSFQVFMAGQDGGDGILDITGGTNRFQRVALGSNPAVRSLIRVSGGTNDCWGSDGLQVGLGGRGELAVGGGIVTTPQIRIGMNSNKVAEVSSLTISGGVVRVQNNINVADHINNSGRLVLDGGLLETPNVRGWTGAAAKGGNGIAILEADGGTVRINKANDAANFLKDFDTAALGPRGLTLDSGAFNPTVAQRFTDKPGQAGTLVKTGSGTLTLSGANAHAATVVAGGTVTLSGAGTLGGGAVVTNGAVLSLQGAPSALTVQTLTLGDATTSGWLAIDPGDAISVTAPNGLHLPFAKLKLSDAAVDGTHTLFTCAGSVALAELNGLEVANPAPGKAYTFAVAYSSGTDSTAVTLTVQNKAALAVTQRVWEGGTGSAWDTAANWTDGAVPQAGEMAVFTDAAATKTVDIAAGAAAGALSFASAAGYTLAGTEALTLDNGGRSGDITASAGSHTVAAPLALTRTAVADTAQGAAVMLSGAVSGSGGVAKAGDGALTLSGANTFTGALTANGGLLDVASAEAFGSASPDRANLLIASGTLRYSGPAAEKTRGFTVSASSSATGAAVFDAASDLTLGGVFWNDAGALIKRGPGLLELRPSGETKLTSGDGAGLIEANLVFDASGRSPTEGYFGLTVAEGTLRIVSEPGTVVRLENIVAIGAKTTQGTVNPALEISGGRVFLGAGSKHTLLGAWTPSGSVLTNPALRVTGGAVVSVDTLTLGHGGSAAQSPELLVDNALVETWWANNLANQNSGTALTTVRNGGVLANLNNETRFSQAFRALIDGGVLESRVFTSSGRLIFGGSARGTLAVTGGGRIAFPAIAMESGHDEGVHILFDGGVFQPTASGMLLFRSDAKHSVGFGPGGATFEVNGGITYTVARPLTGTGGLTKTGGGTLVFGPTLEDAVGATNATGLIAGNYEGATHVTAGTLAVGAGTIRADARVAVDAGAALDLSAGTVTLAELSGAGAAVNGVLAAGTLAPGADGGDFATLTVDGLDFAGVAFECDVLQDGDGAVVASDLLDVTGSVGGAGVVDFGRGSADPLLVPLTLTVARYNPAHGAPDVSQWKVRGTGRSGVGGLFTAVGGEIRVTVRFIGGTIIQVR